MTSLTRRRGIGIMTAVALAGLSGCDSVDHLKDRFKTCQDTVIYLENNPQSIQPVYIIGPEETFTLESRLRSGEQRPLALCVEKGDRKRFRVFAEDGSVIAAENCVASLANYEARHPIVTWTPEGIRCVGW
jgi:hypothetical protein